MATLLELTTELSTWEMLCQNPHMQLLQEAADLHNLKTEDALFTSQVYNYIFRGGVH